MTRGERSKVWIGRALLGFVFVTIGFSMGRQTAPAPLPGEGGGEAPAAAGETGAADKVVVYAAHMTFRCPECNQIEWFTRELLDTEFAEDLAAGRIEFHAVDYMKNPAFARRYNISSSVIVVVRVVDGEEKDFNRLDDVWTKTRNMGDFMDYVRQAILSAQARSVGA